MDQKLDRIHDDITSIKITLERNTVVLEQNTKDMAHHIKRTDLLEEKVEQALLPVKVAKWIAAVAVALASFSSIAYTIMALLKKSG